MPKADPVSDLLREGCKCYHKAHYAVRQFEEQVRKIIERAVEQRADELAAALKLTKAQVVGELTMAPPESDGTWAKIEVRNRRNQIGWGLYFGFEINEDAPSFYATVWLPKRRDALPRLKEASRDVIVEGSCAWISQPIDLEGTFERSFQRLLDRWIALWHKVGGLRQFLTKSKA